MPAALTTPEAFISHWLKAEANERANPQSFLIGVLHPSTNHADGYGDMKGSRGNPLPGGTRK